MTREEAIELLEERKKFNRTMQRGWEQSEGVTASGKTVNTASFAKQHKDEADALDLALSALRPVSREQVENVWRGEWEWYDEEIGSPLEGIEREWGWRCSKCKAVLPDDFDDPDNPPAMRFCQWCGAPMTDEAVQMVMERLEALRDE